MKKLLFILSFIAPLALFANESEVSTDILPRTVNFIIFIAIGYYLLADKIKEYFANRTSSIQSELDKVQQLLKESEVKVKAAEQEIENSKKLALDIIESANADVSSLKTKISEAMKQEIDYLSKSFDDKVEIETKKVKTEVVEDILEELLSSDNISLSDDDLSNIVLKKVS